MYFCVNEFEVEIIDRNIPRSRNQAVLPLPISNSTEMYLIILMVERFMDIYKNK